MKSFLVLICLSAITVSGCDQVKVASSSIPIYVKCHYTSRIIGVGEPNQQQFNPDNDHLYTLILDRDKPIVISGNMKFGNDGQDILGPGHIIYTGTSNSNSCDMYTSDKIKGICDYTGSRTNVSQNNNEITFTYSWVYGPNSNATQTSNYSSETINLIDGTLTGSFYDYNKHYATKWEGQCRKINREIGS